MKFKEKFFRAQGHFNNKAVKMLYSQITYNAIQLIIFLCSMEVYRIHLFVFLM